MKKFPFYRQVEETDCGLACLRMLAQYYERYLSLSFLRDRYKSNKAGVSIKSLSETAQFLGLKTFIAKIPFCPKKAFADTISLNKAPLPCIVHWNQTTL